MNPQLLTTTQAVDPVFILIFGVSLLLLLGITITMLWFVIRYHRSRAPEATSQTEGNLWLEIIWTVLPIVLVMGMFYYGWAGYLALRNVPGGALPVTATARMWSWRFTYANGKTSERLYVPVGKPVLVHLVSQDVLHGFYVPAFRVKRDAVPGMKSQLWFVADRPGSFDLFCSQYCGTGHSAMITTVEAVPVKEFVQWLQQPEHQEASGTSPLDGKRVAQEKGCLGCHSLDGSPKVGPSFKGIWGRKVMVITNGKERLLVVDEAYLRRSMLDPQADVVKGFQPIMPSYKDLSPDEITSLIEFMEDLK